MWCSSERERGEPPALERERGERRALAWRDKEWLTFQTSCSEGSMCPLISAARSCPLIGVGRLNQSIQKYLFLVSVS
jgi:hypothetical protein